MIPDGTSSVKVVVQYKLPPGTSACCQTVIKCVGVFQTKPKPTCMFWDFTMKSKSEQNIVIVFYREDMSPNTIVECTVSLFPQDGTGGWNSKGCRVSPMSNRNKTICLCDHLTHFGILMVRLVKSCKCNSESFKTVVFPCIKWASVSKIFLYSL